MTSNFNSCNYLDNITNISISNKNPPSLQHGISFNKYQNKFSNPLERKTSKVEGFEGQSVVNSDNPTYVNNSQNNPLVTQTDQVITNNNAISEDNRNLIKLQNEYASELKKYQEAIDSISLTTENYSKRVNPNNPYLGKNIKFTDGTIAYVTQQGLIKLDSIQGKGCPEKPFINVNFQWLPEYQTPGYYIASLNLVTGTPMISGQSCGNEGQNVYVNSLMNNPEVKEFGCFNDAPPVTETLVVPVMSVSNNQSGFTSYASSTYENDNKRYGPWAAFNRNNNPYWHSSTNKEFIYDKKTGVYLGKSQMKGIPVKGEWLQINLPKDTLLPLTSYFLKGRQGCCGNPNGRDPCDWYIYGWDGTKWEEIDKKTNQKLDPTKGNMYFIDGTKSDVKCNGYVMVITKCGNPDNKDGQRYCVQISQWNLYTGQRDVSDDIRDPKKFFEAMTWDKRAMNFVPTMLIYTDYDSCKEYAQESGYKYFALQDSQSDGTAKCFVSNSETNVTKYGNGDYYKRVLLWESNTIGGPGHVAFLNKQGSLIVNSGNTAVFATGGQKVGTEYVGCYGDNSKRTMTLLNKGSQTFNLESCQQEAINGNYKYYALQNSSNGQKAQCSVSNDEINTKRLGISKGCKKLTNGTYTGGGWTNAVYSLDPNLSYFLILEGTENTGIMKICKGTGPQDNQQLVWSKKFDIGITPNPNFTAEKSKFGKNWIPSGTTLVAGDFIGSNNGSIYLLMQTDGNLVLYTSKKVSGCNVNSKGKMAGANWINAVYQFLQPSFESDIGKVGYVDEDSILHPYPSSSIKFTNNYRKVPKIYAADSLLPNGVYGESVEKCQTICNENEECYGFTYQNENKVCALRTSGMWPYGGDAYIAKPIDTYIKDKAPSTLPMGVSDTTNNIDSVKYNYYEKGGEPAAKYGLPVLLDPEQINLNKIQDNLKRLSNEISILINKLSDGTTAAQNQSNTNINALQGSSSEYNQLNNSVNQYNNVNKNAEANITESFLVNNNISRIVQDSDIMVLQKNADYLLWSILAAGSVLIAMNLTKSNS